MWNGYDNSVLYRFNYRNSVLLTSKTNKPRCAQCSTVVYEFVLLNKYDKGVKI